MHDPRRLGAIAVVIALPIAFAVAGGSHSAGLLIGVGLVAAGIAATLIGGGRRD